MNAHRRYTPAEDDALRSLLPVMSNPDIAAVLGRSVGSVENRLLRLGLTRAPEHRATSHQGTDALTDYRARMLDTLPAGTPLSTDRITRLWREARLMFYAGSVTAALAHFVRAGGLRRAGIGYVKLALLLVAALAQPAPAQAPAPASALLALSEAPYDELATRPDAVPIVVGRVDTIRVAIDERTWREMFPDARAPHLIRDVSPRQPIPYAHISRYGGVTIRDTAFVRAVLVSTAPTDAGRDSLEALLAEMREAIATLAAAVRAERARADSLATLLANQPPPPDGVSAADSLRIYRAGFNAGWTNGRAAGLRVGRDEGEAIGRAAEREALARQIEQILAAIREGQ